MTNRVTEQRIEAKIVGEFYFTAAEGQAGYMALYRQSAGISVGPLAVEERLKCLTFCVLLLENGFTVTGESACVSPENFNVQMGRDIARKNAFEKVWGLEGYLLKQCIHEGQLTAPA